jgi:hypothetical protein
MDRRKTNSIAQVNLRITPQLQRQLAAAAIAHGNTFSREVRARLERSLKPVSLAEFISDFEGQAGDIIEHSARGSRDPKSAFRVRADLRALLAHTYTNVERVLLHHMQNPELKVLVRGVQQERGKGGKA